MLATVQYANDYKGYLPFCNWYEYERGTVTPQFRQKPGWLYSLQIASLGTDWNNPEFVETGLLWPYLKSHEVYRCPSDTGPFRKDTTHGLTNYLMNGATCSFGHKTVSNANKYQAYVHKITSFKPDAIIFWEADELSPAGNAWNDGSDQPQEPLTKRHGKGAAVACIDGHVDWMARGDWNAQEALLNPDDTAMTNQYRTRAWCNPIKDDRWPDGH